MNRALLKFLSILPVLMIMGCASPHQAALNKGAVCPQTGFLKGAERVSEDTHEVVLTSLGGGCTFGQDHVILDTSFFVVTKWKDGLDTYPEVLTVPYVATILNENGQIVAHTKFKTDIPVANKLGEKKEELRQRIPMQDVTKAGRYKVIYSLYHSYNDQDSTY